MKTNDAIKIIWQKRSNLVREFVPYFTGKRKAQMPSRYANMLHLNQSWVPSFSHFQQARSDLKQYWAEQQSGQMGPTDPAQLKPRELDTLIFPIEWNQNDQASVAMKQIKMLYSDAQDWIRDYHYAVTDRAESMQEWADLLGVEFQPIPEYAINSASIWKLAGVTHRAVCWDQMHLYSQLNQWMKTSRTVVDGEHRFNQLWARIEKEFPHSDSIFEDSFRRKVAKAKKQWHSDHMVAADEYHSKILQEIQQFDALHKKP